MGLSKGAGLGPILLALVGCLVSSVLWPVSARAHIDLPGLNAQHTAPQASEGGETSEGEPQSATGDATSTDGSRCAGDPYPCGGEWPADVSGDKFVLDRVDEVRVTAEDGTVLAGWIAFPKAAPGVAMPKLPKLPTVLSSSPYYDSVAGGTVYRNPTSPIVIDAAGGPGWFSDAEPSGFDVYTHSAGFPPVRLLRKGYAMAYFNVRGTGASGGCFDGGGALDQADQVSIINWIEAQRWSNKRVGMVGLSFPSYYSWQAAVEAPRALKTIVTAGDLIDVFQWVHTPQGSKSLILGSYFGQITANLTLTGGLIGGETGILNRPGCDPSRFLRQEALSVATGDRNAAYYGERTLSTRLGNIKAAVLDTSGYLDRYGHVVQDAAIWGSLDPKTPRVQVRGYWGHFHPTPTNPWATRLDFPSGTVEWERYVTRWFDFWLKGIGPAPRTNVVYHQDQNLVWHEGTSWSPEPTKKEVLYLSQTGLSTTAAPGDVTFRSAPSPHDAHWMEQATKSLAGGGLGEPDNEGFNPTLCPTPLDEGLSHAYLTPAAGSPVLIAGNPFAYANVSSDQPGGTVTVSMYDIEPTFKCRGSHVTGARYIASGSADLNFHQTPYLSREFPVSTPTGVRIDLSDTTYVLAAGHRLAVLVSNGGPYERSGSRFTPSITIHGTIGKAAARASHIVVPVADGTFGGARPTVRYPQRPFTPRGYRD